LPALADLATIPQSTPVRPEPSRTLRILVVDDNAAAAESLALVLQVAGHDVRTVADGPAALAIAATFVPQVVLLDVGLPNGMDGYEVARRLRTVPGLDSAFLVALTGYGQDEDRRRSHEAGIQTHVVKPADPAAIKDLLCRLPI
jgi:two-component system, chemotaxis family, CheB/CheR fusion protein